MPPKDAGKVCKPPGIQPLPVPASSFGQIVPNPKKPPFSFGKTSQLSGTNTFDELKIPATLATSNAGDTPLAAKPRALFGGLAPTTPLNATSPSASTTFGASMTSTFRISPSPSGSKASTNASKRTMDGVDREPKKRVKRDYNDTVTVVVGKEPNASEFVVHKAPICHSSPFFKAACSKEWVEGQPRTVELPTLAGQFFPFYLDWVYSGHINKYELDEHPDPCPTTENASDSESTVSFKRGARITSVACRLSTMADFLGDVACKKACMEILLNTDRGFGNMSISRLDPSAVEHIAENSQVTSGLFRWMVDDLMKSLSSGGDPPGELAGRFVKFPTSVKDALLEKTLVALCPGNKLEIVGTDASKYLDEE